MLARLGSDKRVGERLVSNKDRQRVKMRCKHEHCKTTASFGTKGSLKPEACRKHANEGMVDVVHKTCARPGCLKYPSYGVEGSRKKAEYCVSHAPAGMFNFGNKQCAHEGCSKRAKYGAPGTKKSEYCSPHAREGMVDLVTKKCGAAGCVKNPSYGLEGSAVRQFCVKHAPAGMVNIANKRCFYEGCSKKPTYGVGGTNKAQFCAPHAPEGMVDIVNEKCIHPDCHKAPSYGVAGSKRGKFCAPHAPKGTVNLHKKCAQDGCPKAPSYGVDGSKKPVFCAPHAADGMVNVVNKRCARVGCSKKPTYGVDGSKKPLFCSPHAEAGMVDVVNKTCGWEGCPKIAAVLRDTAEGSKQRYCIRHSESEEIIDVVNIYQPCAREDCAKEVVVRSNGARLFCDQHTLDGPLASKRSAVESVGVGLPGISGGHDPVRDTFIHRILGSAAPVYAVVPPAVFTPAGAVGIEETEASSKRPRSTAAQSSFSGEGGVGEEKEEGDNKRTRVATTLPETVSAGAAVGVDGESTNGVETAQQPQQATSSLADPPAVGVEEGPNNRVGVAVAAPRSIAVPATLQSVADAVAAVSELPPYLAQEAGAEADDSDDISV